jgi:hypothetical protein
MLAAQAANLDAKQHVLGKREKRYDDGSFHSLPFLLL